MPGGIMIDPEAGKASENPLSLSAVHALESLNVCWRQQRAGSGCSPGGGLPV